MRRSEAILLMTEQKQTKIKVNLKLFQLLLWNYTMTKYISKTTISESFYLPFSFQFDRFCLRKMTEENLLRKIRSMAAN